MALNLKFNLRKEDLIQNRIFLIGVAMTLFSLWFGYNRIYKPVTASVRQIKKAISEEGASADISRRLATLQAELERYNARFAKKQDMAWLLGKISKAANEAGLKIATLNSQPATPAGSFTHLSAKVTVTGQFHELGDFVSRIENSKEFIRVDKLAFKKEKESLSADLIISSYLGREEAGAPGVRGRPIAVEEVKYTGRGNRHPLDNSIVLEKALVPAQEKKEIVFPTEKFLVSAVIWDSKRPQAIINDKVVNIGDKLNGGEIAAIDKQGVHLAIEGKEVLLTIK